MQTMLTSTVVLEEEMVPSELEDTVLRLPFQITPAYPYATHSPEMLRHVQEMEKLIRKCIPSSFFQKDLATFKSLLLADLPCLIWSKPDQAPGCVDCTVLCVASKDEYIDTRLEMIFRECLIGDKPLPILSSNSLFFYWDFFPDKSFLILTIKGFIESGRDLTKLLSGLPAFSEQLVTSLQKPWSLQGFFAHRPLLQDAKHARIYQQLVFLMGKLPKLFSSDLLSEMGRFFALCPKSFFAQRSSEVISKILAFHYLIRIELLRHASLYPTQRHLELRYIRTHLTFQFGSKPVLGLVMGVTPMDGHEFLEEKHIQEAVDAIFPHAHTVQNSFYSHQVPKDPIRTIYIELEKKDGSKFSNDEYFLLQQALEHELKRRIEKLVPSIFMARNEEEVMRNVLTLNQELKNPAGLPQVMISLETYTQSEVVFTIVLVRLCRKDTKPLVELFAPLEDEVTFIPDRVQSAGFVRKRYAKEANVFHLCLPKDASLLRADSSVNFYLARSKVSSLLFKTIGPFRDFNGGMILSQGELLYQFHNSFSSLAKNNSELLENFFFSLAPVENQATTPLSSLCALFNLFLEAKEEHFNQKEQYFLKFQEEENQLFVVIRVQESSLQEEIHSLLLQNAFCSKSLTQSYFFFQESLYVSILYPEVQKRKRASLAAIIHEAIENWKSKIQNQQVLGLSFPEFPHSLDPRTSGDNYSYHIAKMLFEGLTRLDQTGRASMAAAEFVDISPDRKVYTFRLRSSCWSNGSPVTANDFAYAWKSVLDPRFITPFVNVFYVIKNAKQAKDGLCSIEDVGIQAVDSTTLKIELENPCPEFLELLSLSIFSPIPHLIDKTHSNWSLEGAKHFTCNGPFLIKRTNSPSRYKFSKNPLYWDADQVRLQQILISKNSNSLAKELFKKGEIHWFGKPINNWDPSTDDSIGASNSHSAGIQWGVFNTDSFPFHNTNLRKAFSLAIDRHDLVASTTGGWVPATSPLPLSMTMNYDPSERSDNKKEALMFFELALEELALTRKTFPLISFFCVNFPAREKVASYLTQTWQALFQISCRVEGLPFNTLFNKLLKGDFLMASIFWYPALDHPSSILDLFKDKKQELNLARWSHPEYQRFLYQAQEELDPVKKIKHLAEAEKVLQQEVPVFSLFYEQEKSTSSPYLRDVLYMKNVGHIDFKHAYIDRQTNKDNNHSK